jgi:hypothetical protein
MNKIISTWFVILLITASGCGNFKKNNATDSGLQKNDTGTAKIIFKEYEHNFGKVTEGEKIAYEFSFVNQGTANLVLTAATTTCGCTVPKYDTKPISPGKEGTIEVVFDTSGRNGIQTKTITVKSNASTPVVLLKIVSEVVANN